MSAIEAQFPGTCAKCGQRIDEGDLIVPPNAECDGFAHEHCPAYNIGPSQVTVEMFNDAAGVWIAPCGTPPPQSRADYEANGWRRLG